MPIKIVLPSTVANRDEACAHVKGTQEYNDLLKLGYVYSRVIAAGDDSAEGTKANVQQAVDAFEQQRAVGCKGIGSFKAGKLMMFTIDFRDHRANAYITYVDRSQSKC